MDTNITAVFSLLGGASEENWTGVSSLPGYQSDFSRLPRKDMEAITRHFETICPDLELNLLTCAVGYGSNYCHFETIFPDLEPAGINLLAAMLTLDPNKRITAKAALEHMYFK